MRLGRNDWCSSSRLATAAVPSSARRASSTNAALGRLIHHVCDHCNTYSMTLADITALIQWLAARAATGTVVRTTAQVIGGSVQPPVQP